ncbi:MAG TPA: TadE family protein [Terracidiphilus sp.]|nr:TadE family protein [Terracidiphilus sp.]
MKDPEYCEPKTARLTLRACLKKLACRRGQSLVELAVSVPVLGLLIFGSVETAKVIYASIELSDAAMAGVQYATRNPIAAADSNGIQNAAAADAPNLAINTTSSLSCICSDGSASNCQPIDCPTSNIETIVTVQTQSTIDPMIHIPGLPNTYTVQGQAIQKVLQ